MTRKKIFKAVLICGCVIVSLFAAAVILCSIFGIGKVSYDKAFITNVSVNDCSVELDANIATSADYYKDYEYTIDGDRMYIKVYSQFITGGKRWPVHVKIGYDTSKINEIYQDLGDEKILIWERRLIY